MFHTVSTLKASQPQSSVRCVNQYSCWHIGILLGFKSIFILFMSITTVIVCSGSERFQNSGDLQHLNTSCVTDCWMSCSANMLLMLHFLCWHGISVTFQHPFLWKINTQKKTQRSFKPSGWKNILSFMIKNCFLIQTKMVSGNDKCICLIYTTWTIFVCIYLTFYYFYVSIQNNVFIFYLCFTKRAAAFIGNNLEMDLKCLSCSRWFEEYLWISSECLMSFYSNISYLSFRETRL